MPLAVLLCLDVARCAANRSANGLKALHYERLVPSISESTLTAVRSMSATALCMHADRLRNSAGSQDMQRVVAESPIPALLPAHLGHPVSAVRHAAVWTAINLFIVPAGASEATRHAVRAYRVNAISVHAAFWERY